MAEKNISQELRLKNTDERRNYLIEEINRNEFKTKKHKKICATLNYIKHFFIFSSSNTGCASISLFVSLVSAPIGITGLAIRLKMCAVSAEIKRYKSII